MLQRTVFAQLARIVKYRKKLPLLTYPSIRDKTTRMAVNYPSPLKTTLNGIVKTLDALPDDEKHWFTGGTRSAAVAIEYLRKNKVIAVPTDTIYGFAALAQSKKSIDNLYSLKGREKTKPLAITLSTVTEIQEWAEIDHLPFKLLVDLLPGPVTVVLKRTEKLNKALNPGHSSVGIRVPRSKFIRHVCKMIGEPLALTSANLSNEPSSLHPDEFEPLWPELGAIFYDTPSKEAPNDSQRVGSTVVDLTVAGKFKIIRKGVRYYRDVEILRQYGVEVMPEKRGDSALAENVVAS